MRKLAVLGALAFLPALAHAAGCPPSSCGITGSAVPGSRLLVIRTNGQAGTLVAYDVVTRARRFALPAGRLAANRRIYFALRGQTLVRYDARTGMPQRTWAISGERQLAAVAPDGDRVVLTWSIRDRTRFWVLDGRSGRVLHALMLRGSYEAEALAPTGRLYLVHWRQNGYDLQNYDFASRRLAATPLAEQDEKMAGVAWSAIASRDDRWLLTLYLKPTNTAFVHALDLRTGLAHCIDLPIAGSDFQTLGSYALALSPDERKLYLANEYTRNLYVIDLVKLRIVRTVQFTARISELSGAASPSAAVSPNGRMLYFSGGGRFVWRYDTAYGKVRGPSIVARVDYGVQTSVAGLAVTLDGRRVVAVRTDGRIVALKA